MYFAINSVYLFAGTNQLFSLVNILLKFNSYTNIIITSIIL